MKKSPLATRRAILDAAFDEIYKYGFQAANLDRVIERTGVTRGALYHHFKSKKALGYAVLEEVIGPLILNRWLPELEAANDPIQLLKLKLDALTEPAMPDLVCLGCPLNNLIQEMSPLDEGFRTRLQSVIHLWRNGLSCSLSRAQEKKLVRSDIDPDSTALFIVCAIEGAFGIAKNAQSPELLKLAFTRLQEFLSSLYSTKSFN